MVTRLLTCGTHKRDSKRLDDRSGGASREQSDARERRSRTESKWTISRRRPVIFDVRPMGNLSRNAAATLLAVLATSLGIWCGFEFQQPSIALLGFVAFLAVTGPLVLAMPVAALVENAKVVILILILPIMSFSVTKLWFRVTENSGESLVGLLVLFACALLLSGAIAFSLVAFRADLRSECSNADHGLGSFLSFIAAGAIIWLTFQRPGQSARG